MEIGERLIEPRRPTFRVIKDERLCDERRRLVEALLREPPGLLGFRE
jgi:hypothetical protein